MTQIFKYELTRNAHSVLDIHAGAKFLSIAIQNDKPVAWFEINPLAPKVRMNVLQYETGESKFDDRFQFMGTLMFDNGQYVSHYFLERRGQ